MATAHITAVCLQVQSNATKGLSSHVSSERACNGLSTYIDSEILNVTKIAQTINEQASIGTFVPGFKATYCHGKPLLAAPKAQKALMIVEISENGRTRESIRDTVAVINS